MSKGSGFVAPVSWIQRQLNIYTESYANDAKIFVFKKENNLTPIYNAIHNDDHRTLHIILQEYATDLTNYDIRCIADFAAKKQVTKLVAEVMAFHQVTDGRYGEMLDLMYSDGLAHELTEDDFAFLGCMGDVDEY